MVAKKKPAKRAKRKRTAKPAAPPRAAVAPVVQEAAPAPEAAAPGSQPPAPITQEFKFGAGVSLFPTNRPITGADVELLKNEAGYDLNLIEAALGVASRDAYYKLTGERANQPLQDVAVAILMRLYEKFPKQLLPFQPVHLIAYLDSIGVHPGEFSQLLGRDYTAGHLWMRGRKPNRSVQLILEAFVRAGVTDTSHPIYQEFLRIATQEAELRGKKLEVKPPPKIRRPRRTRELREAEASLMTPVED